MRLDARRIDHFSCDTRRRAREEMKIVTRRCADGERIQWRILQVRAGGRLL